MSEGWVLPVLVMVLIFGLDANAWAMGQVYEGEASGNILTGRARIVPCANCSGGWKVGDLYQGSSLQFCGIRVPKPGYYEVHIDYISGDPRSAYIKVNNGSRQKYDFPSTGNWQTLNTLVLVLHLDQEENTITFSDQNWYAPDIDRIVIDSPMEDLALEDREKPIDLGERISVTQIGRVGLQEREYGFLVSNGVVTISYHKDGTASYLWNDQPVVTGAFSRARLENQPNGQYITSKDYTQRHFSFGSVNNEIFGDGMKVSVISERTGLPTMVQSYYIYEDLPCFFTQVDLVSTDVFPLATNHLSPMMVQNRGGVDIGEYGDNRVLVVPFDNDKWSRYQACSINTPFNNELYVSSEVTAIYDNESRVGLVVGSVTHDTWKTGIYWAGSNQRLDQFEVYGGFTSPTSTHDTLAHGIIKGEKVASPLVFIGFYEDYRSGLEEYGWANGAMSPPLDFRPDVPDQVPFGWNSWGALKDDVTLKTIMQTSTFFKEHLSLFSNEGNVYINLDSYWDNLSDTELVELVAFIKQNGQRPGIYWAPFVYWGTNMNQFVEGTNYRARYKDIVLKDHEGNMLPTLDGAYALDPTHPVTKQRIDHFIGRFKDLGFQYIKLDFLSHGALEGVHFDPLVQTGIQAYNQGMSYVVQQLAGTMFISASISPLFPSQYAHSRRISCDVDGTLALTEYQLNNLTYGWWQHGTIYPYTDPDYMTLEKGGSLIVAQTRVNSALISGTVFLNSDDVRSQVAQEYMRLLLTNRRINELAARGRVFRPVEGNTGSEAADTFVCHSDDVAYLAAFNLRGTTPCQKSIDLARIGLSDEDTYHVTDLWTGERGEALGVLETTLAQGQSKLFKFERR
ncbi:MAG: carbohydrate-binding protein [Limnochordia bacterium]|nr:carbohydrate-binding protein [Limnochordia bacterium]